MKQAARAATVLARHIPAASEPELRNLLFIAGNDPAVAIGRLAGALGLLVAERATPAAQPAVLGAAARHMGEVARLRGTPARGRA